MARLLIRSTVLAVFATCALVAGAAPQTAVRIPITVADHPLSVVVKPGDHLWKISATHLRGVLGREAADAEIWPYWRTVIEANEDRLRSGDPDLIYPGEVIELPGAS